MGKALQGNVLARDDKSRSRRAKGIAWGLIGGLAGTIVMDLVLVGALSAAGLPSLTCFIIVGNTVGRFFSNVGIDMAGSVTLGVAAHYLIGPLAGAIFGAVMAQVNVLLGWSLKRGIMLAVLYAEILSQPILVASPILLRMTASETVQWFGGSFVMHLIWGAVLGAVVSKELFSTGEPRARR